MFFGVFTGLSQYPTLSERRYHQARFYLNLGGGTGGMHGGNTLFPYTGSLNLLVKKHLLSASIEGGTPLITSGLLGTYEHCYNANLMYKRFYRSKLLFNDAGMGLAYSDVVSYKILASHERLRTLSLALNLRSTLYGKGGKFGVGVGLSSNLHPKFQYYAGYLFIAFGGKVIE